MDGVMEAQLGCSIYLTSSVHVMHLRTNYFQMLITSYYITLHYTILFRIFIYLYCYIMLLPFLIPIMVLPNPPNPGHRHGTGVLGEAFHLRRAQVPRSADVQPAEARGDQFATGRVGLRGCLVWGSSVDMREVNHRMHTNKCVCMYIYIYNVYLFVYQHLYYMYLYVICVMCVCARWVMHVVRYLHTCNVQKQ